MLSDKSPFENRGLRDKLISHDHFRMAMWYGRSYISFGPGGQCMSTGNLLNSKILSIKFNFCRQLWLSFYDYIIIRDHFLRANNYHLKKAIHQSTELEFNYSFWKHVMVPRKNEKSRSPGFNFKMSVSGWNDSNNNRCAWLRPV